MAAKNKWKSGEPDGEDIRNALKAFEDDLQLKARLLWYGDEETGLNIVVEVYREAEGVRIGVVRKVKHWGPGEGHVFTRILEGIYFAYHEAETLAYQSPQSPEARRVTRKEK